MQQLFGKPIHYKVAPFTLVFWMNFWNNKQGRKLHEAQNEIQLTVEELSFFRAENFKRNGNLKNSDSRIKYLEVQLSELLSVIKTVDETSNNKHEDSGPKRWGG